MDVRLPLAEDRVLTGQHRLDGPVPRVIVRQTRIGLGQCSCVVRGLEQCGYPLGLIGQNSRGSRLEEEVVLPGLGQNIGVRPVPPARTPRIGHGAQDGLLLAINAVLGEQFTQLLAADAALAGLDPADLRAVTFEDPRRVVKCVAQALAVPAKRSADDPSP